MKTEKIDASNCVYFKRLDDSKFATFHNLTKDFVIEDEFWLCFKEGKKRYSIDKQKLEKQILPRFKLFPDKLSLLCWELLIELKELEGKLS